MLPLLRSLCSIHAPSGEEGPIKAFLLDYIHHNKETWAVQPEIIQGEGMMDCLMLCFGDPHVAAIAHMDSVGFSVRYENQLIPIGSPDVKAGDVLVGKDCFGPIECSVIVGDDEHLYYDFGRPIQRGTSLSYKPDFKKKGDLVRSPCLDNRAGLYNLLKLAETLKDGLLIFSCWEEHGGGSVPFLVKYMWERFSIKQVLISDITWVSDGVRLGEGVVISIRDFNIPRKSYIDHITEIAQRSDVDIQIEVEASGSSDGREIQLSPYPIDWCFIGAPSERPHTAQEVLSISDLTNMTNLYQILFETL